MKIDYDIDFSNMMTVTVKVENEEKWNYVISLLDAGLVLFS